MTSTDYDITYRRQGETKSAVLTLDGEESERGEAAVVKQKLIELLGLDNLINDGTGHDSSVQEQNDLILKNSGISKLSFQRR